MFLAGMNQPGYLPESEIVEFITFDEAKRYIIEEIKFEEDQNYDDEALAEELCGLAEDVNLESGPFITPCVGGYVYWVEYDLNQGEYMLLEVARYIDTH